MTTLYVGLNQSMQRTQNLITAELSQRDVTSVKVDRKSGQMVIEYRRRNMAEMGS